MRDLGPLHYFLGLELHQSPKGLFLNQYKYTYDITELADLHDYSPVDTHVNVNLKLSKDDGDLLPNPTGAWWVALSISSSHDRISPMLSIL